MLRLAKPSDAEAILAIYAPFVQDTAITFETVAPTLSEIHRRIRTISERYPWLVSCDDEGAIEGYAYASPHGERAAYAWSVDYAIYLRPDCQGRGLGRILYRRLTDLCRALGLVNAYAGIALPNPPSVALHQACGFSHLVTYRHVGCKFGIWRDVSWWQLALREPQTDPAPPRPIGDLIAENVTDRMSLLEKP